MKSHLIASVDIKGQPVGFFSPPHSEQDFPWVDMQALIRALAPANISEEMFRFVRRHPQPAMATAAHEARVVNIICHPIAQGLTSALDEWTGYRGDPDDGPLFRLYSGAVITALRPFMMSKDWPVFMRDPLAAWENAGGPLLRAEEARNA